MQPRYSQRFRINRARTFLKKESPAGRKAAFSWQLLTAIATSIIAIGGVALNLMGHAYHDFYLLAWGINSDLFPKSLDWYVMHGYYIVISQYPELLNSYISEWKTLLLLSSMIAAYAFLFIRISHIKPSTKLARFAHAPRWIKELTLSSIVAGLIFFFAPLAMLSVITLIIIPAAISNKAAQDDAQKELAQVKPGCFNQNSRYSCVEIYGKNKLVARGFLIDSSESKAAFFDIENQRSRIIDIDGHELRFSLPKTHPVKEQHSSN